MPLLLLAMELTDGALLPLLDVLVEEQEVGT
jgi:hypothetical protein